MFTYGRRVLAQLEPAATLEWLVPDGLGGYAMGTAAGLRTRRYHGLLVVSGDTPGRRMMGLAGLDPVLALPGGGQVRLYTHEWASGAVDPRGYEWLESLTVEHGLPCWRWRVGEVVLERRLAMMPGARVVAVTHTLLAGGPVELAVEPVCTWRDSHGERFERDGLRVEVTRDGVVVEGAYRVAGPGFELDAQWYRGAFHREEARRDLAAGEDLLRVGRFRAGLAVGESLDVLAWAGDLSTPPPPAAAVVRSRAAANAARHAVAGDLGVAADTFVVGTGNSPFASDRGRGAPFASDRGRGAPFASDRGRGAPFASDRGRGGPEVVAGYPWFGAWSRDTMISYEGLFLCTRRHDEGRELLRAYAGALSQGMLANTADTGRTEYNTADATLWFLHAVDRHLCTTGDDDLAAELADPLGEIVRWHLTGTRYGIRIDDDGLLTQGAEGKALTWMDAVVGGEVVTPRRGKAVELNALWINGLAALGDLRERLGRDRTDLDRLRADATAAFQARFPSPRGWLYDTVDGPDGDDAALRPNQLLAFSLPHAPLRGHPSGPAVVGAAGRALLTPLGPRSLAPGEPGYRGAHRGGVWERDHAYHQGTVWPWLIGPYVDAARAAGLPTDTVCDRLWGHLAEYGIGSVSETADGDAPHDATGCPFQAWSVAEFLRVQNLST